MYQPWILATVTAAGAGLVALTATLQRPPVMPEPVTPSDPAGVRILPPDAVEIKEPAAEAPVLELEPLVIRAVGHRAAPEVTPVNVGAERPCSAWRDLGPTHVVSGRPSGELSVRSLCP